MDARVATRYAKALFNAAQKERMLDSVADDLNGVVGSLEQDARFKTFLLSKVVGRDAKQDLLQKVFGDRITSLTMSVLKLMLSKNREDTLFALREEFLNLKREHDSVLLITITSAMPLSSEHQNAIIKKIETASRKKVIAETSVDATLLGGVKVEFGGYVMDGSVSGSLQRMRETLVYDTLKQA